MRRALVLLLTAVSLPATAMAQSMEDRARTAAEASRAKTSDSDTLQQNYLTPGLAGQPIATIDNSKSFNPNIACQKTATLLELIAQPASSGDIGTLRISRDKNLDGAIDQTLTLPMPVSGICANGVIGCQPGTWNQCHFYKWDVGGSGDLKLSEVAQTDLAGCYCINNSCGANLAWGNLASLLKDLGGGVIGALTTADPRIGVAQAVIDGPVIRYTGAQSTACSTNPSLPQTAYRSNPTAIVGDATVATASSSVFQALKASPSGVGKAEQIRACTIIREVTLQPTGYDDIISVSGQVQSVMSCGTDCRRYRIGGNGNCSASPPIFTATFQVHKPDRLVSARIVRQDANDWLQSRANGEVVGYAGKRPWLGDALPSGDCNVDAETVNVAPIDITDQFRTGSATVGARVRGGGDGRWGWIDLEVRVDTSCGTTERVVDLCAVDAADSKCQLYDETVDGVTTVKSGVATGLTPLPQARLFQSGACSLSLVRPWFERQRRYRCTIDTGSLPEPDLSRGAYIIDHSTETLLADRVKNKDGSTSSSTSGFALPDRGSVPTCEAICKTRAVKANSEAALDGVVGAKQNAPVGYDTFYHSCTATSSGNHCPLGPGEELVSDCGCLDDFPEAVVMMQTVRLGGADMICTSEAR